MVRTIPRTQTQPQAMSHGCVVIRQNSHEICLGIALAEQGNLSPFLVVTPREVQSTLRTPVIVFHIYPAEWTRVLAEYQKHARNMCPKGHKSKWYATSLKPSNVPF